MPVVLALGAERKTERKGDDYAYAEVDVASKRRVTCA